MKPSADAVRDVRRALSEPLPLCRVLGLQDGAQRQAGGLLVRCPWHPERRPSCSVTRGPDGTIRAHCFACGASGDALSLIARVHGFDVRQDFRAILAVAATIAGLHQTRVELEAPLAQDGIDDATFHALATELIERCPFDAESDVLSYLDRRVLIIMGAKVHLFALPTPARQGGLLVDLVRKFGTEAIARAGFVKRSEQGRPQLERFVWPGHRLGIPWRNADGTIATIQRRRIDSGERKYVFPRGRAPGSPFGSEALYRATPRTRIAFAEGALDVLALRLLAQRDGDDLIPLGIPGVANWRASWATLARGHHALVALDADRSGESKRALIVRDLFAAGALTVERFVPVGNAKDWAELVERSAA